ncbi:hypothetical protein, partial [Staphylococcus aureus]
GGIALFDPASQSNLTTASPKVKVIGSAAFDLGKFSATARGTVFGVTSNLTSPNGGTFYLQRIPAAFIADLEVGYQLTKGIQLTVGANNLF